MFKERVMLDQELTLIKSDFLKFAQSGKQTQNLFVFAFIFSHFTAELQRLPKLLPDLYVQQAHLSSLVYSVHRHEA